MLFGLIEFPAERGSCAGTAIVFPGFVPIIVPVVLNTELKQYSHPIPGPPPPTSSIGWPKYVPPPESPPGINPGLYEFTKGTITPEGHCNQISKSPKYECSIVMQT